MTGQPKHIAGYAALVDQLSLNVIPHHRKSYITQQGRNSSNTQITPEEHVYSKTYALKNPQDPIAQLIFALKYDGINLEILQAVFLKLDKTLLEQYISENPNSKYARKLWYLYELLSETQLSNPNTKSGKYVDLIEPEKYFTTNGIRSQRHRINDNLLGNKAFCPIVRKTERLKKCLNSNMRERIAEIVSQYQPNIMHRAINYLYAKETRSSYAIEREKPSKQRETRFINLLKSVAQWSKIDKETLVSIQNTIVEPRFQDVDYRCTQNYVGEQVSPVTQRIHYISPKPTDLSDLMQGLLDTLEKMCGEEVHPLIIATVISFGFVFIHPFEDGNGRLHRFLIHYILSKTNFIPKGTIFPISAVMLKNKQDYDNILERFSEPLLSTVTDYFLSNEGELTVKEETKQHYQYVDFTAFAEYLCKGFIKTIEDDFQEELEFIKNYDEAKHKIQNFVDMPDKLMDLMIKFIHQNHGTLSTTKRSKYFSMLEEKEIARIETIVAEKFYLKKRPGGTDG